jgi:hypothetical protein
MLVFPPKRNLHLAIGCALAGALFVAAPARAQQDESAPEVKMLDGIMGALGLSRSAKDGINYRERSPLVIPPNAGNELSTANALPPPESNKVADPNWPVDPEVKEARARAAAQRKSNDGRTSSQVMDDNSRPLLPSELEKGRTSRAQHNIAGGERTDARLSSTELGYKGGLFGKMFAGSEERPATFTGETPRTSLVEPPAGYQTPSPAQPYALGKSTYRDKAIDPMERTYQK